MTCLNESIRLPPPPEPASAEYSPETVRRQRDDIISVWISEIHLTVLRCNNLFYYNIITAICCIHSSGIITIIKLALIIILLSCNPRIKYLIANICSTIFHTWWFEIPPTLKPYNFFNLHFTLCHRLSFHSPLPLYCSILPPLLISPSLHGASWPCIICSWIFHKAIWAAPLFCCTELTALPELLLTH